MSKTFASPENATHLLGAAASLGLDKQVVQMKFGELVAPDEVFAKAGFTVDDETGYAHLNTDTAKKTTTKKVAAKKVADPAEKTTTKRTAAKRTTAKKSTAKKTAAPAEKE